MKKLKLSLRLFLGFSSLLLVMIVLGSIAVVNMQSGTKATRGIVEEQIPILQLASEVERATRALGFEIRGYGLTGEKPYLDRGLAHLAEVRRTLQEAQRLGQARGIKEIIDTSTADIQRTVEYEKNIAETTKNLGNIKAARDRLSEASAVLSKATDDYQSSMERKLNEEVQAGIAKEKLVERTRKMKMANDIQDTASQMQTLVQRALMERRIDDAAAAEPMLTKLQAQLADLRKITTQQENMQQIASATQGAEVYRAALTDLTAAWKANDTTAAYRLKVYEGLLASAASVAKAGSGMLHAAATSTESRLDRSSATLVVGLLAAVLLGVTLALLITRSLTRPLRFAADTLAAGAEQVAAASSQVASASQALAAGASQQAASLEETSASMEEMSSMTKRNAESSAEVNRIMAQEVGPSFEVISNRTQLMREAIELTVKSSQETSKIVKTIDEIAFQTNILALNAAVEAARAGDAGMGFAVVADEVRALAQRSAVAAKETARLIEESNQRVAEANRLNQQVVEALDQNTRLASKVTQLIGEISAGSQEQSQGIGQVSTAVRQMDQVTQNTAASAEESAAAAEEMSSQAHAMQETVMELRGLVEGTRAAQATATDSGAAFGPSETASAPARSQGPSTPAEPAGKTAAHGSNGHSRLIGLTTKKAAPAPVLVGTNGHRNGTRNGHGSNGHSPRHGQSNGHGHVSAADFFRDIPNRK